MGSHGKEGRESNKSLGEVEGGAQMSSQGEEGGKCNKSLKEEKEAHRWAAMERREERATRA